MHNLQRLEAKLWERLSGEADGKALPHNGLLSQNYHIGSALTRSIERSASQNHLNDIHPCLIAFDSSERLPEALQQVFR